MLAYDVLAVSILISHPAGEYEAVIALNGDKINDAHCGAATHGQIIDLNLSTLDQINPGAFVESGGHLASARYHQCVGPRQG